MIKLQHNYLRVWPSACCTPPPSSCLRVCPAWWRPQWAYLDNTDCRSISLPPSLPPWLTDLLSLPEMRGAGLGGACRPWREPGRVPSPRCRAPSPSPSPRQPGRPGCGWWWPGWRRFSPATAGSARDWPRPSGGGSPHGGTVWNRLRSQSTQTICCLQGMAQLKLIFRGNFAIKHET